VLIRPKQLQTTFAKGDPENAKKPGKSPSLYKSINQTRSNPKNTPTSQQQTNCYPNDRIKRQQLQQNSRNVKKSDLIQERNAKIFWCQISKSFLI